MNTPNPLVPQGSLQEHAKGKSNFRIAFFTIAAIHLVFFGVLLMQGCQKKVENTPNPATNDAPAIPTFTNDVAPLIPTNNGLGTNAANGSVNNFGSSNNMSSNVVYSGAPTPATNMVDTISGGRTYTVVAGDILASIAKKMGVSVKAIETANPGLVPTKLKVGQKIQIPGGSGTVTAPTQSHTRASATSSGSDSLTYTVKTNDNLTKIAKNHGTSVKTIRELNNLTTDRITVGQKLKMPAGKNPESTDTAKPAAQ